MWIKSYLNLSPSRPRWAFVADALIAKAVTAACRRVDTTARINTFLQTWRINTAKPAGLSRDVARMIKTAQKYGVKPDAPRPGEDLIKTLPVWYHFALTQERSSANTKSGKCLRTRHRVAIVADCISIVSNANTSTTPHRNRSDCACDRCEHDRNVLGCDDPARCRRAAQGMLIKLQDKWRPGGSAHVDGLSLSREQRELNVNRAEERGEVTFNPFVTQDAPMAGAFRAFIGTDEDRPRAARPARPFQLNDEAVEVFTDGSCEGNGTETATAGAGVWFGEGDPRNAAVRVPGECQTNQAAEAYACLVAAERTPDFAPLTIITD
ncbi:hypothetical protein C2E23DRAFT_713309, partial [Lenzites betulinus]